MVGQMRSVYISLAKVFQGAYREEYDRTGKTTANGINVFEGGWVSLF